MRYFSGSNLLRIGVIFLLAVEQQRASERSKRVVDCLMACIITRQENNNGNSARLSGRQKELDALGCKCTLGTQRGSRSVRSLRESKEPGTDKTVPTLGYLNQTTIKRTVNPETVPLPGMPLPSVPGVRIVSEDANLSAYSLSPPDPNHPPPTIPDSVLKHLFPSLYKDRKKCPYRLNTRYSGNSFPFNTTVRNLDANFLKTNSNTWLANITWDPPEGNLSILVAYLAIWNLDWDKDDHGIPITHCKLVNKSATSITLNETVDWKYPYPLHIVVSPLPKRELRSPLKDFYPVPVQLFDVSPPPDPEDLTRVVVIAVTGAAAGVLLFIALLLVYKRKSRKRRASTPTLEDDELPEIKNGLIRNLPNYQYFATYYQESPRYTEEVATVVTTMRGYGYDVTMDQFKTTEICAMGFGLWVDSQFRNAKKIVVFCSPGYLKLWRTLGRRCATKEPLEANDLRVRYEINRICSMYVERLSKADIVCITLDKKSKLGSDLPEWMKHNILEWPNESDDIIRRMIDESAMVPYV